jgi:hypothetical protein
MATTPPSAIKMGVSSDASCRLSGYPMLKIASSEQIAALLIPGGAGSLLVRQRHGIPDGQPEDAANPGNPDVDGCATEK